MGARPRRSFSPAKVEAAQETFLAGIRRAVAQVEQRRDTAPHADRRLLCAWSRQDAELGLTMVRLCLWGRTVVVDLAEGAPEVAAPTPEAPIAARPTLH